MNVAKTYIKWEKIGEIYLNNNKQYVKAKNPNTGIIKEIRVYTDKEYARLYPANSITQDNNKKPQKDVLGFTKGYITIFKYIPSKYETWFEKSSARYCRLWGWYFISEENLPIDLPKEIEPIKCNWELVGNKDGKLKSEEEINKVLRGLKYV